MNQAELVQILHRLARDHKKRVSTIRDVAAMGSASRPAAGMALLRAKKNELVERVANLWINRLDPPDLIEIAFALISPSYLSFESALYRHGVLSQSPRGALTLATPGRPRTFETPWGNLKFIHLKPPLFFGYDAERIASPEKAFLDLIYLRGLKRRPVELTEEIHFERFSAKRLRLLEEKFPSWVGETRRSLRVETL